MTNKLFCGGLTAVFFAIIALTAQANNACTNLIIGNESKKAYYIAITKDGSQISCFDAIQGKNSSYPWNNPLTNPNGGYVGSGQKIQFNSLYAKHEDYGSCSSGTGYVSFDILDENKVNTGAQITLNLCALSSCHGYASLSGDYEKYVEILMRSEEVCKNTGNVKNLKPKSK